MNQKYSNEDLADAVKRSKSWMEVERRLVDPTFFKPVAARQISFKRRALRLKLDTSHFTGQGHRKGKTQLSPFSEQEMFCENSKVARSCIRRYLMGAASFEHACSICGITEWLGSPVNLVLDHINGIRNDNRRENLRFICPNCDSTLPTFTGRNNVNTVKVSDEDIAVTIPKCVSLNAVCSTLGLGSSPAYYERIRKVAAAHNLELIKRPTRKPRTIKPATPSKENLPCIDCHCKVSPTAQRCKSCANKYRTRTFSKRPKKDVLVKLIWEKSMVKIGEQFGVSGNAVKKWCTYYNLETPPVGYWAKLRASHTNKLNDHAAGSSPATPTKTKPTL